MQFQLSKKSLNNLIGVHPDLVAVVKKAIEITEIDFVVIEGLRTLDKQKLLLQAGATTTLNSRHLTGHAVDLAALVGKEIRWDWPLYHKIAYAMKQAANDLDIPLEWGAVWDKEMSEISSDFDKEIADYTVRQRMKCKKAFLDGPHFQLSWKSYT